jgi:putative Holliday junction resolvase
MRTIALDYGDKTIGVAVSDPRGIVAIGVETIRRSEELGLKKSLKRLGELIQAYEASEIVLGYPKRMDNTEGQRCEKTKAFKQALENRFKGVPVELWDERFSTIGAMRGLESMPKSKAGMIIDQMAAVYILQGYLDLKNSRRKEASKMASDDNEIFVEADGDDEEDFDYEEECDVISMETDDGGTINFVVLDTISVDGVMYLLVVEEDQVDEEEGEYTIVKYVESLEDGAEEVYEFLQDEEFDRIADLFDAENDEDEDGEERE